MFLRLVMTAFGLGLLASQSGCIAASVALGAKMLSSDKQESSSNGLEKQLIGKGPAEADRLLGSRVETLIDTGNAERQVLLYRVKEDKTGTERYAVDVSQGKITALTKGRQKTGAMEAAAKAAELREHLLGKSRADCEKEADIGKPVNVLRSREQDHIVCVYDASGLERAKGARYCVLRFDKNDRCVLVNLIGVMSSTKEDPARG